MAQSLRPLTPRTTPRTAAVQPATRRSDAGRPTSRRPVARPRPFRRWFAQTGWRHLVGVAVVVFAAFPLVYVFSASLNPGGTLITANTLFGNLSLQSYVDLFNRPQQPFAAWYVNTLFIGFSASAGSVMLGALAAYAFSRMRFTGRRFGLITILLVQMFPQLLAMVAIFLLMLSIGETSGRMIVKKIRACPAPSILAASSMETGMVLKKPYIR